MMVNSSLLWWLDTLLCLEIIVLLGRVDWFLGLVVTMLFPVFYYLFSISSHTVPPDAGDMDQMFGGLHWRKWADPHRVREMEKAYKKRMKK